MSIMLARLPLTFAEIRSAIINLDTLRLDESMVKGFLDFLPTKDEVRAGIREVRPSMHMELRIVHIQVAAANPTPPLFRRSRPSRVFSGKKVRQGHWAGPRSLRWRYGAGTRFELAFVLKVTIVLNELDIQPCCLLCWDLRMY